MTAPATPPVEAGDSIDRQLWRIAWPLIVGASLWNIQIVVDRMMLGWYGHGAAGSAMTGGILFWVPLALFHATVMYAATFVAQYLGAGRPDRVGAVVWQSLWLAVLGGVAFLLVLLPLVPSVVALTGHEPHLQAQEEVYLRWLVLSALPYLVLGAVTSFFAGRGASVVVMLADLVGVVVNLAVGYVFIFGRFGAPEMGIEGAGLAIVVGNSCAALFGLAAMFLPRRYEREFGTRSSWRIDWRLLGRMLYFGLPSGIVVGIDVLSWALFIVFIGRMGELELTVTTIAFTLNLFAYLPAMGLGQAVGILVGNNQGKGDPDASAKVTWRGLYYAMGINGTVALFFLVMPQTLAWMFQDPATSANWEQVVVLVAVTLRFVVLYVLFDTMNLIFSHALRGAGDTLFVSLLGLVVAWPVLVFPSWAAYEYKLGMFFAWGAATTFVILLALAFLARFVSGKWRTMRVIEETLPVDAGPAVEPGWPTPGEVVLAERPDGVVSSERDRISEEPTEASKT